MAKMVCCSTNPELSRIGRVRGGLERAVQGHDVVGHIDVAKILPSQGLEPRGGDLPRADEGTDLVLVIAGHTCHLV